MKRIMDNTGAEFFKNQPKYNIQNKLKTIENWEKTEIE